MMFGNCFGCALGITATQAQDYARGVSTVALLETTGMTDKERAEAIIVAVINLQLPSINDEKQVIMQLPMYGVSQSVVDLALKAIPPYETTTSTAVTPGASNTNPIKIPTTTRLATVQTSVSKAAGMSTPVKVALGVSVVALVGALVMINKNKRAA